MTVSAPILEAVADAPVRARREFPALKAGVGRQIAHLRVAAGLTQEEAATAARLDTRAWQRLEAGEVNPTLFTLLRVAIVLDATLPEVVTQLGPEANPRRPGRPRRRS